MSDVSSVRSYDHVAGNGSHQNTGSFVLVTKASISSANNKSSQLVK